jgi:tRNA A-37 threonylcarbamoyl transferase component Bud32
VTQPTPGRVLADRYRLEAPIARGGMASVWLAHDELLGRRVAVKALHSDLAGDEKLRARFRQEAIAAAGLSHPNIVATYDTGDDDGLAYIVMELIEGESLRQLLDRKGSLDVAVAVGIARQVSAALEAAHRNGVVHRDVKPGNVLVPREGSVKVTDFGIAKATGSADFTRTGMVVGTARYLSPEQVQGQPTDARTDVYSLGLVLYEMLAGRPAYQGDSEMATAVARLAGPPPPLPSVRPGVPPGIVSIVDQALQPDPAHRIPSAAAFGELLERGPSAAVARPQPAVPPPAAATPAPRKPAEPKRTQGRPAPTARPKRRRGGWLRVLAFIVFLALLGLAAGLLTVRLVDDNGGGGSGGGSSSGSSSGAPPDIATVADFDPFGTENPGRENPDAVPFTYDGLPDTEWHSEQYATRKFGNAKPGVGLVVTLEGGSEVSAVEIDANSGYDAEIYVADEAADTLAGWGTPRAKASGLEARATVELSPSVNGRFVLVWFTLLPESGRLDVAELRVR